ncbi:MAG: acetyl ornithine aminotransferase family protein [Candidatus Brocadiales bacterium]
MSKSYPFIKIQPPGPKAKELLKKDQRYISPSPARVYPLMVKRANGAMVEDVDGNRYLDFTAGVAVSNTGHCHPRIVKAITQQSKELLHMSGADFYSPLQIELAERLDTLCPGPSPKRVFFSNSGAESVEAAIKLVHHHTKRYYIIAFINAFHGRTLGALSLTGSKPIQRKGFAPLLPGVVHVPYAYCYRCAYGLTYPQCKTACVSWIEEEIFTTHLPAEEVAAVFVEPIQGEGGYIVPPKEFIQGLGRLCKKYGIMLVADEVQSGMGRTGKMLAIEHYDVLPDVVCLAKGIASGLPLGATIASNKIMDWPPGAHASTFGGSPVSCRAALTTIDILKGGLIENAAKVGNYLLKELQNLCATRPLVGEVRGKGLMIAVEMVKDKNTKKRAGEERNKVVEKAFKKGLLLLDCGHNAIRFVPPLIITKKDTEKALSIFDESLKEVEKGMR